MRNFHDDIINSPPRDVLVLLLFLDPPGPRTAKILEETLPRYSTSS